VDAIENLVAETEVDAIENLVFETEVVFIDPSRLRLPDVAPAGMLGMTFLRER